MKPGACLASLPEQQVLLWGPGAQAVALALEEAAVDFCVLGQGLDDGGLAQASLPQLLLPQQPVEQLLLGGVHLHGATPQPQRAAVVHLQTSGERESELDGVTRMLLYARYQRSLLRWFLPSFPTLLLHIVQYLSYFKYFLQHFFIICSMKKSTLFSCHISVHLLLLFFPFLVALFH